MEQVLAIMQSSFLESVKIILDYTYKDNLPTFYSSESQHKEGINVQKFYLKHLNYDDICELKNLALELLEHLIENDSKRLRRFKIVNRITFETLSSNLIRIYNQFLKAYGGIYAMNTADFMEPGFKIFALLQDHHKSISMLDQFQSEPNNKLLSLFH